MSGTAVEETLRLQFGTASNTIGTQWLALRDRQDDASLMRADGTLRLIAFEAKDRIRRHHVTPSTAKRSRTAAEIQEQAAWTGNVQVYDQLQNESANSSADANTGLWSWASCSERNLFEVSEFRAHMPLHNFYEGYSSSKDGCVTPTTFDAIEDRLRSTLEECDRLRTIQSLVDMDSSWGGLAVDVLTYLSEECPRAAVVTLANDWPYPLADQSAASVFALAPDSRDRAKNNARRSLNIGSALSLLSDVSSLLVPLALAEQTLPARTRFTHLQFGDVYQPRSCRDVATLAATAIEVALSAHRVPQSTASAVVDGIVPSRNILALAAQFPFTTSATTMLARLANETEVAPLQAADDVLGDAVSLLPAVPMPTVTQRFEDEDDRDDEANDSVDKVFLRRLHLRGRFSDVSLSHALERARSASCVVQWTPAALQLPTSYCIGSLAGCSVDAVAQLSATSRVGRYVRHVMQGVETADKRVLFEFTRAGMNVDALEDLDASLGALRDAYL